MREFGGDWRSLAVEFGGEREIERERERKEREQRTAVGRESSREPSASAPGRRALGVIERS